MNRKDYIKIFYKLFLLVILASISHEVAYVVAGPQTFNPYIYNYWSDKEYQYGDGTLDIGPIYGNIETTLTVSTWSFEPIYISSDKKEWKEIKKFPNVSVLGNVNVEKGARLNFYIKARNLSSNSERYLNFGVSRFDSWHSPVYLVLIILILDFLIKVYQFILKEYEDRIVNLMEGGYLRIVRKIETLNST